MAAIGLLLRSQRRVRDDAIQGSKDSDDKRQHPGGEDQGFAHYGLLRAFFDSVFQITGHLVGRTFRFI
jgi:hypothetical protein